MIRREQLEVKENFAGGKGKVYVHHVLTKEELNGHGRLYARVVLPPGSSIGFHTHVHDTEPYFILSGEGTFIDNEHNSHLVHAGDVCLIEVGEGHSMENNSEEDVVFMGLIYNEPGFVTE